MSSILSLPSELLLQVMDNFDTGVDRVCFIKTCKLIHAALEHTLYEYVWIRGESDAALNFFRLAPTLPRQRLSIVYDRFALLQTLRKRLDLRKRIRSIIVDSTDTNSPRRFSTDESEEHARNAEMLVGTALQTEGGLLPDLRLISNFIQHSYAGHVSVRVFDGREQVLDLGDVYHMFSGARLQSIHLRNIAVLPMWQSKVDTTLQSQFGLKTLKLKHVVIDSLLEYLRPEVLKALLSWPKALESFACAGFRRPFSDRPTSRLWDLVEWLRPQRKTLKQLRLMGCDAQILPATRIKPLVNNLESLDALETLSIGLESIIAFDNDLDLSETQPQTQDEESMTPCKLPPRLRHLFVRVSLNLFTSGPDVDDMVEKRAALNWIAESHKYLHSVHIYLACTGAAGGSWAPAIVQRRANDILECREAFARNGTRFQASIMLLELGEGGLFPHDALKGWRLLPAWMQQRRKQCQVAALSVSNTATIEVQQTFAAPDLPPDPAWEHYESDDDQVHMQIF